MGKHREPGVNVSGIITLLTDFGLRDPYVGIMKGVILSINPDARIIDISHQTKPGSVYQAAGLLQEAYPFFPKGTIHVAVVDPGVGSDRRPILIKTKDHLFVGPDNGMFWPIIKTNHQTEIIHLTETKYFLSDISNTFHGRDIFAPVAAHVSLEVDPLEMGSVINNPIPLHLPIPEQKGAHLLGQVMRVDHFGNLISNIHKKDMDEFLGTEPPVNTPTLPSLLSKIPFLAGKERVGDGVKKRNSYTIPVIKVRKLIIKGICSTYSEVNTCETLALIGSSGYLEIAVNQGRACDCIGINLENIIGIKVEVNKG